MPQFYTLLTDTGQAKVANAVALGIQVEITHMAVGDGGGSSVTPDSNAKALVNEVRRAPINAVQTAPDNPTWITVEQVLPPDVGGWTIREVGVFDAAGDLIAIGNLPETYKPVLSEGSSRTQTIRVVMEVSDTTAVTLKVDPSVVLATRQYVDDLIESHSQSRNHPAGTESKQGMLKLSTPAQALAGEDDKTAMPPARVFEAFQQFGLGGNAVRITDWNDITVSGFYESVGGEVLNTPDGTPTWRGFAVMSGNGSSALMIVSNPYDNGKIYRRSKPGGVWSRWQRVTTEDQFTGENQSLGTNGWQKLPGGLVIQWITLLLPNNLTSGTLSWPIAFPERTLSASGIGFSDVGINPGSIAISATRTGAEWWRFGSTSNTAYYVVTIGR